jgi:hypothetical protein
MLLDGNFAALRFPGASYVADRVFRRFTEKR